MSRLTDAAGAHGRSSRATASLYRTASRHVHPGRRPEPAPLRPPTGYAAPQLSLADTDCEPVGVIEERPSALESSAQMMAA